MKLGKVIETVNKIKGQQYDTEIITDWINEVELPGMPNKSETGFADYVLYDDMHRPLAIIEAKRTCVDVSKGRQQAKLYADLLEQKYKRRPVIFLTNGFDTHIIDGQYPERKCAVIYSKRDLEKWFNLLSMRTSLKHVTVDKNVAGRYYQEAAVKAVCDSFEEKNRRKALLVMATGSGKTTIINLLMRFYDVSSGKIFIDGKDIRDYDVGVLREKFGAVFQNDIIFEDSVSENIKLGRNITDENMKKAAKASCIDSHISQMDEGYDSFLAIRGNNLSGGQKQRMLISRAVAGNPEILVLDDSSSALDYKTDAAIRKNIDEMGKNTTTIIVAQRVSSVLDCDKIIVIDEGRIAACGNHDKLLKTCAIYARISSLQSGITQ